MEQINFKKIVFLYNQIKTETHDMIYNNLKILEAIYETLGESLEEYNGKEDIHQFFIDKIVEITQKILTYINEEEKEILLNSMPLSIRICILKDEEKIKEADENCDELWRYDTYLISKTLKYSDDEKIKILESIKHDELKSFIIQSMQNDDKKIDLIKKINIPERYIVEVSKSIRDDNKKISLLDIVESEGYKAEIIRNLQDDSKKIILLENMKEENNRVDIILSLRDDEIKIKLLETVKTGIFKVLIICSLANEDKKINLLNKITNETDKTQIIVSLSDDEKKILLLPRIQDEKNRKEIIYSIEDDEKKIQQLRYIQEEKNRIDIIKTLNDDDKKIELLSDITNEADKVEIIETLKDDDRKISQLANIPYERYRVKIIKSLKSDDKKISLLNSITEEKGKTEIISSISDDDKKIEQIKEIKLTENIIQIIETIYDDDKIIDSLKYLDKEEDKIRAASKIFNPIKKMKTLSEISENYKRMYELIEELETDNGNYKYNSLNLPPEMTIGIEIESTGTAISREILPEKIKKWRCEYDTTIGKYGKEYVSPIMRDNEIDIKDIYRINEILRRAGMKITQQCGGHVHIGANYIKSEEGFKELVELWGNAEEIYYLISNKPGEIPRKGVEKYAVPISGTLEKTEIGEMPQDSFILKAKGIFEYSRYRSLNLMNVHNAKDTIEFRLSNGTLDANTWIENIRLYGRTVQRAQELGEIAKKRKKGEELTEEEKTKYALKEMLKGKDIPLDAKMEILMRILFDEEERGVYQERFEENKKIETVQHRLSDLDFGNVDLDER